jgi:hypothetical protein
MTQACGQKARYLAPIRNRMDVCVQAMLQGGLQQITLDERAFADALASAGSFG